MYGDISRKLRRAWILSAWRQCPTPPTSFSEEDFRWCVMAVAWWIQEKRKNTRRSAPLLTSRSAFSCGNKRVGGGLAPRISQRCAAVSLRPAMAAHKPVEWVQAVITRFDEQVRVAHSGFGCSSSPGGAGLTVTSTQGRFPGETSIKGALVLPAGTAEMCLPFVSAAETVTALF